MLAAHDRLGFAACNHLIPATVGASGSRDCHPGGGLGRSAPRSYADAAEIEVQAKCRLAGEYDAAQERGEVAANG
jgi:hypothetical protein